MKKNFRAIALGLLGLALFSCQDNNEPITQGIDTPIVGEAQTFTLSASMGEISVEPLANNTNEKVNEDDLRATLSFENATNWARTSYKWDDFGVGANKVNARWGALLGSNLQTEAKNCTKALEEEPAANKVLDENSIWFNIGATNNTIAGQKLMMYCKTGEAFGTNIKKSWMCLGGRSGSGAEKTRQYFKMGEDSNPNKLIKALKAGESQEGREIPVMTAVAPYDHFQKKSDGSAPDAILSPRGSLVGIIINNKLGREIKVKDIIVNKASALDFSGYFDWNKTSLTVSEDADFVTEYPNGNTALVFPVDQSGTNHIIATNNDEAKPHNDNPSIFYIWGFQSASKKGQPLRLQIRYTSTYNGVADTELTTRTFRVYPGKTKATATEFVDGKAYKTVLNLTSIQQKGGTTGNTDWSEADNISEETTINAINPLQFVAKYDIAKVANTQGINHELKFVTNHKVKANEAGDNVETDYTKFEVGKDVGLYTWAEAMRLFGYDIDDDTTPVFNPTAEADADRWSVGSGWSSLDKNQFDKPRYKTIAGQDYYMPNIKEWIAIVPYYISVKESVALQDKDTSWYTHLQLVSFTNDWSAHLTSSTKQVRKIGKDSGKTGLQDIQIGDVILRSKDYSDDYITKEVPIGSGNYITYAIRFRGTKFESAWRYEYKKAELIGTKQTYNLVIKNVMLWKDSDKTLAEGSNCVATEEFFDINNATERIFPARGNTDSSSGDSITQVGSYARYWSRTYDTPLGSYYLYFGPNYSSSLSGGSTYGTLLRPFARNHY